VAEKISVRSLTEIMRGGGNYALIDVRERQEYEGGQIFGATQIPRRLLEFKIQTLVPARDLPVILYDGDGSLSAPAALTLERLGYSRAAWLEGGVEAWKAGAYPLVEGVNVPSKSFGEMVESREGMPQVLPEELKSWLDSGQSVSIIEVRPPEEVRLTGSIPGAVNVPGVDLPVKIHDLAGPGKKVVLTCAGRTRGIIATQTMRLLGQEVYDLKNGTMGWLLAGYDLQQEIPRGGAPSPGSRAAAETFARRLIDRQGIDLISVEGLLELRRRADREAFYQFDVRSREEYEAGHIPGTAWLPGGQAIQCADEFVAVRGGNIVFYSGNLARAVVTAYWYRQMGFPRVFVLGGGTAAWEAAGGTLEAGWPPDPLPLGLEDARRRVQAISAPELKQMMDANPETPVIDVGRSISYGKGHIPGAHWVNRGRLEMKIGGLATGKENPVVCTCPKGYGALLAAATLKDLGYGRVRSLEGGTEAWAAAGLPLEVGLSGVEGRPDDIFLQPWERNRQQMSHYLNWEVKLAENPFIRDYFKAYLSAGK